MSQFEQANTSARELGHEPETESVGTITIIAIGVLLTVGMSIVLVVGFVALMNRVEPGRSSLDISSADAPSRVTEWSDPPADLGAYHQREKERLETYGWIDREAGVVHIPIERAMELVTGQEGQPQ